ncbi:MAG: hypothetical protein Q8Q31_06085 [Nanoarchaeota archaeon]|nr:hypothetical protein [Nanoarchaeota archaeon]
MAKRLDGVSESQGYEKCGLCTGQGPLREDEGLVTLYINMQGNPDMIRNFLDSGPHAPCAGVQMYLMTHDQDLGIALIDHCMNKETRYLPACPVRRDVFGGYADEREIGRVGLGRLRGLLRETLYTGLRSHTIQLPIGEENPEVTDFKQIISDHLFADCGEVNPDGLTVQEGLVPLNLLDRPRRYTKTLRQQFESDNGVPLL